MSDGVEFIGPLDDLGGMYHLTWQGCVVPHLTARKVAENAWNLMVWRGNTPFMEGGPYPAYVVMEMLPIIAQVAAVAAGYSAFGRNGRLANPYAVQASWIQIQEDGAQVSDIGGPPPDET